MSVIDNLEEEFKNLKSYSKTTSEAVLADLHQEALLLESRAKQELVLLRQRAANLGTDVDTSAEEAVIHAKNFLAQVLAHVSELESRLGGYSRVKDYDTAEKFEEAPAKTSKK